MKKISTILREAQTWLWDGSSLFDLDGRHNTFICHAVVMGALKQHWISRNRSTTAQRVFDFMQSAGTPMGGGGFSDAVQELDPGLFCRDSDEFKAKAQALRFMWVDQLILLAEDQGL